MWERFFSADQQKGPMSLNNRILVIDDEPDIADFVADLLRNAEYDVDVCYTSDDAESLIKLKRFFVIFSDVTMPNRSGFQLFRDLLQQNLELPHYVFISGNLAVDIREEATKLGAVGFIQKPFFPNDLFAVLERIKSRHQCCEN